MSIEDIVYLPYSEKQLILSTAELAHDSDRDRATCP